MPKESLLSKLINISGVSSDEKEVRDFIIKEVKKYVKNVKVDKLGNVIAIKKGIKPVVMLMAHMDEIGMMVSSISKDGKISISPIGGIDPYILIGQKVHIKTRTRKRIGGLITTTEVLDSQDLKKNLSMDELFIFTGLTKKEILAAGVEVGSYVHFTESSNYCHLGNENIIGGKALDDRIGCYMLLEVMRTLKTRHEVVFVFTVQEEVGLYGSEVSVFNLSPDYAIAVDVTPHNSFDDSISLRNGPVLTVKDAEMIANKCLVEGIEKAARRAKVKLQLEVSESGTTDATSVFVAKGGIPSAVFGVPVGNLHTAVSVASKNDIEQGIKVLGEFLKSPPNHCLS
ncbi:hypothetical protein CO038_02150 [Candidatus Pacearchaeota archaeon CG_4_9_14_0_2_um_filter_39_13]|nr:M42 family metallopeptidase [Candidatus Pacearchaeota archaeon]OIO43898.1 MAG: hypothetical protein AUJ64_01205 [Candidatus Pacearchaeota archaeon CG1_02_39_14]PJC44747.1 MAG: hypothetical protein CO038_02150 [Candidatus Pacearchaeota archaeon CG_4_9_14_0_2_um_filter_39_13]